MHHLFNSECNSMYFAFKHWMGLATFRAPIGFYSVLPFARKIASFKFGSIRSPKIDSWDCLSQFSNIWPTVRRSSIWRICPSQSHLWPLACDISSKVGVWSLWRSLYLPFSIAPWETAAVPSGDPELSGEFKRFPVASTACLLGMFFGTASSEASEGILRRTQWCSLQYGNIQSGIASQLVCSSNVSYKRYEIFSTLWIAYEAAPALIGRLINRKESLVVYDSVILRPYSS